MLPPRTSPRRPIRKVAAAAALTTLTLAGSALAPLVAAAAPVETCEAFGEIPKGKYWLNNNLWGAADNGTQCLRSDTAAGKNIAWQTNWDWSGEPYQVKSFTSAVLGWHWGWKRQDTELPIRLSDDRTVATAWKYDVSPNPGVMNVAYDLWAHDIPNPDWGDDPTDEIMIWLYRSGGAGPLGTKVDTVTIAGTRWDLYKGYTAWNVFSFVRVENTEESVLDLTHFTDELVRRGDMSRSKYLSSVQAGPEIFTGKGTFTTTGYMVDVK